MAVGAETGLEGERMEGPTEGEGGRASAGLEDERVGEVVGDDEVVWKEGEDGDS